MYKIEENLQSKSFKWKQSKFINFKKKVLAIKETWTICISEDFKDSKGNPKAISNENSHQLRRNILFNPFPDRTIVQKKQINKAFEQIYPQKKW